MVAGPAFSESQGRISRLDISAAVLLQSLARARISGRMANVRMPLVGLCALHLLCVGCSSGSDSDSGSAGAGSSMGGEGTAKTGGGNAGLSSVAGSDSRGGVSASGGTPASGGVADHTGGVASVGNAGKPSAGAGGGPPPAVDGQSVYALECHGDSKDCNLATVPCFGVSSPTPNVAAGWACANRCISNADCSDAPSGAEAQASCVPFSSASHCVLVCKNENQTFACPDGMACYVPAKSPIGYCLWQ